MERSETISSDKLYVPAERVEKKMQFVMFLGIGRLLTASALPLPTNRRIPSPDILKPSHCISI